MSLSLLLAASFALALLYWLAPGRFRWALLLLCSLALYAYAAPLGVPFILLTALSNWGAALCIERIAQGFAARKAQMDAASRKAAKAQNRRRQRAVLIAALLLNFGILCVFKLSVPLSALFARGALGLVLPLGISFYTFQSVGYLLDVYAGKIAAERRPLRFLLFVSFFPQLIQGPIARFDHLAPQLTKTALFPHAQGQDGGFDLVAVERGLLLIVWGLFQKKVLADRAMPLVEAVFSEGTSYGGAMAIVAALLYSLQQYCDFAGGIHLVTGIAELYGIRLAPNFRQPYFAVSLGDFWRRWHISLGAWMRDYVFYPFALCRPVTRLCKAVRQRGNTSLSRTLPAALGNVLVFFLVGIWHGVALNYVLWGLYNGVILAISALLEPRYKAWGERHSALSSSRGFHILRVVRTFVIVNIGWFFDRATHGADSLRMLGRVFVRPDFGQLPEGLLNLGITARDWRILAIGTALLFATSLAAERGADVRAWVLSRRLPLRWLMLMAFFLFILATFVQDEALPSSFMYAVF